MKNFHNIEKSKFRRGVYIGYGGGKVWSIRKSTSSYGNWFAHNINDYNDQLFAFGLDSLSQKLSNLNS
jgi:hypothetical protein